ncbi:TPA: Egl nine 1 [Trebouxia sp. C0004]
MVAGIDLQILLRLRPYPMRGIGSCELWFIPVPHSHQAGDPFTRSYVYGSAQGSAHMEDETSHAQDMYQLIGLHHWHTAGSGMSMIMSDNSLSMSDNSLDEDDTSVSEQEEEEIVELSEEDLLQLLDNQEPALQVCSRLFYEGWDKHTSFSCLSQSQVSDLQHRGFIIRDDCLAEAVCDQLHAKAVQLHSAGDMRKAAKVGLMPDMLLDKFTDVSARGDSITWLHEGSSSGPGGSAGLRAMQVLQEVQADLHSVMRLEKRSAEYQLAVYVGCGSQYVKHRDALPDDGADLNQRRAGALLMAVSYAFGCHLVLLPLLQALRLAEQMKLNNQHLT